MTSKVQTGSLSALGQRYGLIVKNGGETQIPAFAVMQVVGATNTGTTPIYTVGRPTGAEGVKFVINTPEIIPVGQRPGAAADTYPIEALIAGSPFPNQEIGPVAGSWALSVSGKGFIYLGGLTDGVGRVAAKGGTSAGDDFPLVQIVNTTGMARQAGTIVGYGALVDSWASRPRIPTFAAAAPTAGKPIAILLSDVNNGDVCDAAPVGTAWTMVNVTDASHEYAEAINGNYANLVSAASGQARILRRQNEGVAGGAGLGVQAARVRLDPVSTFTAPRGIVVGTISRALGGRSGTDRTPGIGVVQLFLEAAGPIGSPCPPGPNIPCETWMQDTSVEGKPVLLRPVRKAPDGSTIYEAIAEGCKAAANG